MRSPRSFNNANLPPNEIQRLKSKAQRVTTVSVRLGGKKFELPVECHVIVSGQYAFVSIPSINVVAGVSAEGGFTPIHSDERDMAVKELKSLKTGSTTGRGKAARAEVPDAVKAALAAIPKGYKLVTAPDGTYKLAKTREKKA